MKIETELDRMSHKEEQDLLNSFTEISPKSYTNIDELNAAHWKKMYDESVLEIGRLQGMISEMWNEKDRNQRR